jgi:hypothetical protein
MARKANVKEAVKKSVSKKEKELELLKKEADANEVDLASGRGSVEVNKDNVCVNEPLVGEEV